MGASQDDLLDMLEAAHRDLDLLLAQLVVAHKPGEFLPSKSPVWPNMEARAALLRRYGRLQ